MVPGFVSENGMLLTGYGASGGRHWGERGQNHDLRERKLVSRED